VEYRLSLQKKVAIGATAFSLFSVILNLAFVPSITGLLTAELGELKSLFVVTILTLLFLPGVFWEHKACKIIQAGAFFLVSIPMTIDNPPSTLFGLQFAIVGIILFYKYGFLKDKMVIKMVAIVSIITATSFASIWVHNSRLTLLLLPILLFLLTAIAIYYFIFEEQIQTLLKSSSEKDKLIEERNRLIEEKDKEIAAQAARIMEMEPLSELGERMTFIVHSFKNNLAQLSSAAYLLEEGAFMQESITQIRRAISDIDKRLSGIMMVSQGGNLHVREPFGLRSVLESLQYVYLHEVIFLKNADIIIDAPDEVMVTAVRWDILMMLENILQNAIEAIIAMGKYGHINIELREEHLKIENDGGTIRFCVNCDDDCMPCERLGRVPFTTKEKGSGHGVIQIFKAARDNQWELSIHSGEGKTAFVFTFPPK
jgi:signal transduction histidine kinase